MKRSPSVPSKPAFYARISQDRTGMSVGVDHQVEEGLAHLRTLGWPEPIVYRDNDISARSGNTRPGFERLIADLESGAVDGLAARHLDRLLRRVTDLERVLDAVERHQTPVPVLLVHGSDIDLSSASGRLLARILASVAANESEIKSERVGAARRREAQAGKAHGHLGYGYDREQRIVPEEAAVIKEVASQVMQGRSLRSIAGDLNARGVPTPGAGRWDARRVDKVVSKGERPAVVDLIELARSSDVVTAAAFARALNAAQPREPWTAARVREQSWNVHLEASDHGLDDSAIASLLRATGVPADATLWRAANLRAMIRRGALCGWREFSPGARGGSGELVAQGEWTPILTKDTLEKIRRVTNRPGVRGREPKHLLAGVLKCGQCGSGMGGSPDGRGGTRYACSKQPGRPSCGGLTVAGAPVEAMVSQAVIDTLADANLRRTTRRTAATPAEVAKAQHEIDELDELRDGYIAEAVSRRTKPAELARLLDDISTARKAAERVVDAWAPSRTTILQGVPAKRPEIRQWWDAQPISRRREVISVLIEAIPVAPAAGATRFDPARIGDPLWKV